MARQRKEDGFEHFETWLLAKGTIRPTTAKVYTSGARRVVKEVGDIMSASKLDRFFDGLYYSKPFAHNNLRRSWTLFTEWAEATKGLSLPRPGGPRSDARDSVEPLPYGVREALCAVLEDRTLPLKRVPEIRWSHVRPILPSQSFADVADPQRPGNYWRVSREILDPIRGYAQSNPGDDAPLVPASLGSPAPYSYTCLRREVARHRRTRG